ncbi:MAG: PilZ domain-containing protein [Planctomycetes bacterium]|jgi:c-di-GMP-binding flagellar brake protein YcgR|nr:PilZ domain-containing protein [Planctomycetota bacterium]
MSETSQPIERRRHQRTMVQMKLKGIRLDPEEGELIDTLRMVDISRGGMGAVLDRPAYPGQRFVLNLPLTGHMGRRRICATVMRCKPTDDGWRIGLEFEPLSAGNWIAAANSSIAAA